jgi:aspartokinase/homoserine dehydrogenase 1
MQVLKFGGTSVADAGAMSRVVDIVSAAVERDRTILVCSAISKCTDTLIEIGHRAARRDDSYRTLIDQLQERHAAIINELLTPERQEEAHAQVRELFESLQSIAQGVCLVGELSPASLDAIVSFGELLSTRILAIRFAETGIPHKWIDARQIIRTERVSGRSVVVPEITNRNIVATVERNPMTLLFIVPGFIAADREGRTTTLGRGGSDYTAALLAVGIKARLVEIWTDVPGMMTANPKSVPTARTIRHISYRAALELSHFGAKVIYPPTIQPVVSEGIPIYVKNTFDPSAFGTLIEKNPPRSRDTLTGITNSDDIALLSLEGSGMVGIPGFSSRLFDTLTREDINIILITQASSVHTMCIAVSEKDAERARRAADNCFAYEISLGKLNPLKVEKGWSIVCLVGDDVIGQSGATGRMLAALGAHGIQVRATAQGSSERNISVIVPSASVEDAVRHIHNEFFDKRSGEDINLFVTGYGTVGKALVEMIATQADAIATRTGKRLVLCGLANSRRFVLDPEGLDAARAAELLAEGRPASDDAWFEALAALSLTHPVFVDCTASSDVACRYRQLLQLGYHVVACNKIAFSAPDNPLPGLHAAALAGGVTLRYETTVGASLPVLESVSRIVSGGDRLQAVEAVLSGTLAWLFDHYAGGRDSVTFAELVEQARVAGYTEPDPAIDLSGRDVLRKLLILGREAGIQLEESDIEQAPLPAVSDEAAFAALHADAERQGRKLRYVASLVQDPSAPKGWRATIGLQAVGPDSPLYALHGTDNCAIFRTGDYASPLVIQGAGAGARITASGLLNDILL